MQRRYIIAFATAIPLAFLLGWWVPNEISSRQEAKHLVVISAIHDLAELHTVSMHMQQVIDLKREDSKLFGLVQAEDSILLIAAGDISAGVDLQALLPEDVVVDDDGVAHVRLPKMKVFHASLNNELTRVHSRTTDILAARDQHLESDARKQAVLKLKRAAIKAGILKRAEDNAKVVIRSLLISIGVKEVEFESDVELLRS